MDSSQGSDRREGDDGTTKEDQQAQAPADKDVGSGVPAGESTEGKDGGGYASGDTYSGTEN